jgi:hypothetical protein
MPRLRPLLLWRAGAIDPLLPRLLLACRDINSARNELRWLREHAQEKVARARQLKTSPHLASTGWRSYLRQMVDERATGKPLQYILGTEYFGDLEIVCREGVLIPRQVALFSSMKEAKKKQRRGKEANASIQQTRYSQCDRLPCRTPSTSAAPLPQGDPRARSVHRDWMHPAALPA